MKIKFPLWFYQLASPKWFYEITGKLLPWFTAAAILLLTVGCIWGLVFAPPDYQQGNSFRIIYIHVPSAILAQSCYMLMAVAGAIGLIWKIKMAHIVAKSCAPIGASIAVMALATGAIWGKPTWGAWWVWDARLTAMLILFFLYLGVLALSSAFENEASGNKAAAVLALVGLVNIPIIKYSVEWWNTLHQPATFKVTQKPAMPPEMWIPLLIMVIGFYCFFAAVLMARARIETLEREKRKRMGESRRGGCVMGQFASFADFLQMGKHGLYVWLSYGIALGIILYNVVAVVLNKRRFFNEAKRRLRREQKL